MRRRSARSARSLVASTGGSRIRRRCRPSCTRCSRRCATRAREAVAMEVSSHALALDRVDDVRFRVAVLPTSRATTSIFTRRSKSYAAAKRRLFSTRAAHACSTLTIRSARVGRANSRARGRDGRHVRQRARSDARRREICRRRRREPRSPSTGSVTSFALPGRFNVWNALAAIGVGAALGIDPTTRARAGSPRCERVPGRMERIARRRTRRRRRLRAHARRAGERAARRCARRRAARLAVVFGCGGDRDRGKRAEMGAVAARLADRVYRDERQSAQRGSPRAIADDIVAGIGSVRTRRRARSAPRDRARDRRGARRRRRA